MQKITLTVMPGHYFILHVRYPTYSRTKSKLRLTNLSDREHCRQYEWTAPLVVPVLKKNGSVWVCGDYKQTVNQAAKLDTYPLLRIEDLFASLTGGMILSKLKLNHAHLQVPLDVSSKKYVTVNTHKGLFYYNHLSFGVTSTPSIFLKGLWRMYFKGLNNVFIYLDDILVSGKTPEDHVYLLEAVLHWLDQAGLRLKHSKCLFVLPSEVHLCFQISAKGLYYTLNPKRFKLYRTIIFLLMSLSNLIHFLDMLITIVNLA